MTTEKTELLSEDKENTRNHLKFVGFCGEIGDIEMAKRMYFLYNIDIHWEHECAFINACRYGHIDIAKWLYSLGNVNVHILYDNPFVAACTNNNFNIAQWLYSLGNINCDMGIIFFNVCCEGNLEFAKWICNIDVRSEITNETSIFANVCDRGYLKMAQWIYSRGNVNAKCALGIACKNEYYDMILWALALNVNSEDQREGAFIQACSNGKLKVAQLIYSHCNIDIHALCDMALVLACKHKRHDVVKWIYSLDNFNVNDICNAYGNSDTMNMFLEECDCDPGKSFSCYPIKRELFALKIITPDGYLILA